MMENKITEIKTLPKEKPWLLNILGFIFFGALAYWTYHKISIAEANLGVVGLPKILVIFYDLAGKWGVVGFWLLFVLYNLIFGLKNYLKKK